MRQGPTLAFARHIPSATSRFRASSMTPTPPRVLRHETQFRTTRGHKTRTGTRKRVEGKKTKETKKNPNNINSDSTSTATTTTTAATTAHPNTTHAVGSLVFAVPTGMFPIAAQQSHLTKIQGRVIWPEQNRESSMSAVCQRDRTF